VRTRCYVEPRRAALRAIALALIVVCTWTFAGSGDAARPATGASAVAVASAPGWVDVKGGLRRLGAAESGIVQAVLVKEGGTVDAGDVLLRLDDRESAIDAQLAEIEVQQRRAENTRLVNQLALRRRAAERLRPLVKKQAEPEDELRRARADVADLESRIGLSRLAVESAELRSELAEKRLSRHAIRAPSRGRVVRVLAHPGDAVTPGSALLWFAGAGPLIVRAELDERLLGKVRAGMNAEVSPEYDERDVYKARVLRVSRVIGPVTALPEVKPAAKDDRVVEVVLELETTDLLIGQRVLVRIFGGSE
jgi:RND family efflux transporter MFP subunit